MSNQIKDIYRGILNSINKLIPEKWKSVHLYASVNRFAKSEMFFYYIPKKILAHNPVSCYEVSEKFGINEEQYIKGLSILYEKIKQIHYYSRIKWTNVTIVIDEDEFIVKYHFNNLNDMKYTDEERHMIWKYQNLNIPLYTIGKRDRSLIENYVENSTMKPYIVRELIYFYDEERKIK